LRRPGRPLYAKILKVCGKEVLGRGKSIDPRRAAARVFASPSMVKRLNAATHPAIIAEIKKRISASKAALVILDAPLLMEAHARGLVDLLIVVKAARQQQIRRLRLRSGISRAAIIARIRSQLPLSQKAQAADLS